MQMGTIDLNPEFQREVVWTPTKQSHLIDSILKNFYIPPIIFSCKKLDSTRWMRICIDGKQRLTSIRRFMENEIPHTNPAEGNLKKRYYRGATQNQRHLSDSERECFDCSELVCVEYYDLTLNQEQEIFSRVQLGMPLTAAEKLQAISSPLAEYAHTLFTTFPNLEKIIEVRRGRPFQLITQSLHMIETEPEIFRATPTTISKYLKEDREVPLELRRTSKRVFETLAAMIDADEELINRAHKLAPIEFVFLCWMIAKYPNLSIAQYQQYLLRMKQHVRQRHIDIRFNSKVYETLRQFVEDIAYENEDLDVPDINSNKTSYARIAIDNYTTTGRGKKRIKTEPVY
ncbi:hypothetical protein G9A89_004693 [Geosiphon pyriformis]|nr:hypothetical protein G9A89_004693 [Geosiphon pyriformis]